MKKKITLTIDSDLYAWLQMKSRQEGRSISNLVSWLLRQAFKNQYKEDQK